MKKFPFVIRHSAFVIAAALAFCSVLPLRAADLSITAANVAASASATRELGTAGVAITAGQAVYLDTSSNTYKLADANAATPLYKMRGIALHGAGLGQPLAVCTKDDAFTLGGTVASGQIVVLSATPGGLCIVDNSVPQPAPAWYVQVLGVGIGSNKIKFNLVRSDAAVPTPTATATATSTPTPTATP